MAERPPGMGMDAWKALLRWSLEHSESQGDPSLSSFAGMTEEEIQAKIDFLQDAMKHHTVDVGKKLQALLARVQDPTTSRPDVVGCILQIEELVENLDFADLFARIDGLGVLESIILNDDFEWEDVRILSLKIIAVCLFNTDAIEYDVTRLYDILLRFLRSHQTGNIDFLRALLFALNSFVTTSATSPSRDIFAQRVVARDIPLLLSLLRRNSDFNVRQKLLHCLSSLFQTSHACNLSLTLSRLHFPRILQPLLLSSLEYSTSDNEDIPNGDKMKARVLCEKLLLVALEMFRSSGEGDGDEREAVVAGFAEVGFWNDMVSVWSGVIEELEGTEGGEGWEDVGNVLRSIAEFEGGE